MSLFFISRTGRLEMVGFLFLCLLWGAGGYLIVRYAFSLKPRERPVAGLAAGFILFIVLSNLFARVLPLSLAYWASVLLILLVGLVLALRSKEIPLFDRRVLKSWPQIAVLAALIMLFFVILRGLTIFDDYYQLPLISMMATGDIPPNFFFEPSLHLPYHYGLQVFAAALVRVGGLFPWSAWDLSRAIVLAFTPLLGWLWIRRITNSRIAAVTGAVLLLFGSGSRWLLLFIPQETLIKMSAGMNMFATGLSAGGDLVTSLTNRFPMEGNQPFPFPFAYANGLLEPLIMNLGATGAMWEMTILLLLLLYKRWKPSTPATVNLGMILGSLALSAEHVFALLAAGLAIAIGLAVAIPIYRRQSIRWSSITPLAIPLGISALLALFQGGYITDWFLQKAAGLIGQDYPMMLTDFQAFSLRWPPAVPTGHFGPLAIFDPAQLAVLMAEAGPALFLIAIIVFLMAGFLRKRRWLYFGIAAGSILSFIFPIIVRYGLDFDITRLVGAALWLWMAISFPFLWRLLAHNPPGYRLLAGAGYVIAVYGGLVMLAVQLIAMPMPQTTYFIGRGDILVSREYWNQTGQDMQILDINPERAVVVFGRPALAGNDVYKRSPVWEALVNNIDPVQAATVGYTSIYMDNIWWNELTPAQRTAFQLDCVNQQFEIRNPGDHSFRRLYDIKACKP